MRDLQVVLGVDRATIVGHSRRGGVALQFAYQYPERVERLVLVASGGLGAEVHPVLRAAALPGAFTAIGVSVHRALRLPPIRAARLAAKAGLLDPNDVDEVGRVWEALRDPSTRTAFLRTRSCPSATAAWLRTPFREPGWRSWLVRDICRTAATRTASPTV